MDMYSYWQKQTPDGPLFPDIEWNKPEQKRYAGKLTIIGGNKLGFAAPAQSYSDALKAGIGDMRVVLPDALRRAIPATMVDSVFVPTNASGGISKDAEEEILGLCAWSDGVLLIGDTGRNSETAIVMESLLQRYSGPLTVTRDGIDLLKNSAEVLLQREQTVLVVSFAQLQKLFQAVYYPKTLLFSMQLTSFVEALHKFTITFPVALVVLHQEQLIVAHDGNITSTPFTEPMRIWRGSVASRAAVYWIWNQQKPLEAVTASFL
ncbi:hypothetical protein CYG49_02160 [Candidatus Saccharibacteria bacterium]|nr:MAG: hypothetical protein CYG49_02160 [Candidatus Saccharibacteria bacterium]